MKIYLFLRSVIWSAILSLVLAGASIISSLLGASLPIVLALGMASISSAILADKG